MEEWVVLVKIWMRMLTCRPALAAGGGVSRALLRQGETLETASRFARVRLWAELSVCETDEIRTFSAASLCRHCAFSATLALALLYGVDFLLVRLVILLGPAPDGADRLSFLSQVDGFERMFADVLQRCVGRK